MAKPKPKKANTKPAIARTATTLRTAHGIENVAPSKATTLPPRTAAAPAAAKASKAEAKRAKKVK